VRDLLLFPYITSADSLREKARHLTATDQEFYSAFVPCSRCHGSYEPSFFRRHRNGALSRVCLGCLNWVRRLHGTKLQWKKKISSCRRTHSIRLKIPADLLGSRYRWDDRAADEMKREYATGTCPDCRRLYSEFPAGELTVDILLPEHPHWGLNTRLCCKQCNSQAQNKGAGERQSYSRNIERWKVASSDLRERFESQK